MHFNFLDRLDLRYTSQGYINLQSLVKCLYHRNIVSDTGCTLFHKIITSRRVLVEYVQTAVHRLYDHFMQNMMVCVCLQARRKVQAKVQAFGLEME